MKFMKCHFSAENPSLCNDIEWCFLKSLKYRSNSIRFSTKLGKQHDMLKNVEEVGDCLDFAVTNTGN